MHAIEACLRGWQVIHLEADAGPRRASVRNGAGVYTSTTDGRIYCSERVNPGVMVVTGLAGGGMTLSPAIAEKTWEEVLA